MNDKGERLRFLRQLHNLTQEDIGKILGVQRAAINKYETGLTKNLKDEYIQKLSVTFKVNPAWLLGYDVPMDDYHQIDLNDKKLLQAWDAKFNPNGKKAAQLMNDFNQLNDEGQDKVIEYTEDIVSIEQYQKKEEER